MFLVVLVVKGVKYPHTIAQLTVWLEVQNNHIGKLHDNKNENGNRKNIHVIMTLLKLFFFGQIGLNGIPVPAYGRFSILDGLLWALVDTAHTLIALYIPEGFALFHRDGRCRTILFAQAATVAGLCYKKGLGTSGKTIKAKVGKMRFYASKRAFMNTVCPFLLLDFLGNLCQLFSCKGKFAGYYFFADTSRWPKKSLAVWADVNRGHNNCFCTCNAC